MEVLLVSIIIPVFNSERWLSRCLDSVVGQSYKRLEIIIIDDGSSDKSGTICDEYASKDYRIRVFHQKNQGVSVSRQKGVDCATGEYIIHVDSDDWIEKDMVSRLCAKAVNGDYDMVMCDYYEESSRKTKYCHQDPGTSNPHELLRKFLFQQLHGSCWNKLVKRVCSNLPGVAFPQGINIFEDLYVTCQMLSKGIKIGYLPEAFYHYFTGYSTETLSMRVTRKSVEEKKAFIKLMKCLLFPYREDDLYCFKKDVLFDLFLLREYDQMKQLYPETQRLIRSKSVSYNVLNPNGYILKMALDGKIFKAQIFLHASSVAIKFKNILKLR